MNNYFNYGILVIVFVFGYFIGNFVIFVSAQEVEKPIEYKPTQVCYNVRPIDPSRTRVLLYKYIPDFNLTR